MNLQEFTKTTLVEIVSGIHQAREDAAQFDATVGLTKAYATSREAGVLSGLDGGMMTQVEFDVVLAAADGKDGGVGVCLDPPGKGAKGEAAAHSRIKFSVPLVLPGKGE